jgi:hypothetical protein
LRSDDDRLHLFFRENEKGAIWVVDRQSVKDLKIIRNEAIWQ